jgi:zinc protease
VLQHGFQEAELKESVANFKNALEQAAKTAPTRRSHDIADELASTLADKAVFTHPADDLALLGPALAKVTPDQCLAALREAWAASHRYVLVSGNAEIPGDAPAAIKAIYEKSHATEVKPPEQLNDSSWGYTEFGPAGTVSKREQVADLDVTLVTFANGVRLNLKKTDFEANRIRINARLGTGQLTEPKDKPGLAFFTSNTFSAGGLGKHSADDLERILAGRTVGLGFRAATDAFNFSATTNREDLLLQLQLFAAYITDPGYRPEALRQIRKGLEELYSELAHKPDGPLNLEVPRLLASGDPRFGLPPKEAALSRTLEESRDWLAPQLATGAIEIALVGDLDIDATIAAVGRTLGALPTRGPRPALNAERQVRFPEKGFVKEYSVPTEIPKGIVALYWPTTDANDIHRTRRLMMLSEVLSDRLRVKVRQELGGAYSPDAGSVPSDAFPGYGYMLANVTVDPAKAAEITDVMLAIANDLNKTGVTEDELERAKQPILTSLRESARTNGYWIGSVLSRAQEKPEVLDWCRSRYDDNKAITKADLDALAKNYLVPDRVCRVIVRPEAK